MCNNILTWLHILNTSNVLNILIRSSNKCFEHICHVAGITFTWFVTKEYMKLEFDTKLHKSHCIIFFVLIQEEMYFKLQAIHSCMPNPYMCQILQSDSTSTSWAELYSPGHLFCSNHIIVCILHLNNTLNQNSIDITK